MLRLSTEAKRVPVARPCCREAGSGDSSPEGLGCAIAQSDHREQHRVEETMNERRLRDGLVELLAGRQRPRRLGSGVEGPRGGAPCGAPGTWPPHDLAARRALEARPGGHPALHARPRLALPRWPEGYWPKAAAERTGVGRLARGLPARSRVRGHAGERPKAWIQRGIPARRGPPPCGRSCSWPTTTPTTSRRSSTPAGCSGTGRAVEPDCFPQPSPTAFAGHLPGLRLN